MISKVGKKIDDSKMRDEDFDSDTFEDILSILEAYTCRNKNTQDVSTLISSSSVKSLNHLFELRKNDWV